MELALFSEKYLTEIPIAPTDEGDELADAAVTDALVDLRHLCDRHGLDFAALDRMAYQHYSVELWSDDLEEESIEEGEQERTFYVALTAKNLQRVIDALEVLNPDEEDDINAAREIAASLRSLTEETNASRS